MGTISSYSRGMMLKSKDNSLEARRLKDCSEIMSVFRGMSCASPNELGYKCKDVYEGGGMEQSDELLAILEGAI